MVLSFPQRDTKHPLQQQHQNLQMKVNQIYISKILILKRPKKWTFGKINDFPCSRELIYELYIIV